MTIHLIKGTTSPSVIPIEVGCHYIDTVNKKSYISVGTSSVGDWKETAGGGSGGGAVDSVFGRIGVVTAQAGDYTAGQVGAYTKAEVDNISAGKIQANAPIIANTKTKISYDSKGLVTAGSDLAPGDIPSFIGASAVGSGTKGGVPAPTAGDQLKFLRADGTWQTVSGGGGGAVTSVQGRTGDVVITKADLGLSMVDNTADVDKPISTATQTAIDGKVTKNLPITAGTFPKITYDAKGLVISGAALQNTDIPAFTGAGPGNAGTNGGVPAPPSGQTGLFLKSDGTWASGSNLVTSVAGRIGDVTLTKLDVGLGNVDNTSDADKPVSTATQTALAGKVTANSAITGGTFPRITFDEKGLVTFGTSLAVSDIPAFTPASAGSGGSLGGVPASSAGDQLKFLRADGTWQTVSAGGTPGGANTNVQFNDNGSFNGTANLTWDTSTSQLVVTGLNSVLTDPTFTVRSNTLVTTFQVRNTGLITGLTLDTGTLNNAIRIGPATASTVNLNDGVAIGRAAGVGTGTGTASTNVFIGAVAGNKITTGARNVGVGGSALNALTSGADHTVLGNNALRTITTLSGCTAIGSGALGLTTGGTNTAVGINAGAANIDGTGNTFLGATCANAVQYVSNGVYLGASVAATNGTVGTKTNLEIVIGANAVGRGTGTTTIGTASNISTQMWGDLFLIGNGKGIRLTSPNGSITKTLTIDNTGAIALL